MGSIVDGPVHVLSLYLVLGNGWSQVEYFLDHVVFFKQVGWVGLKSFLIKLEWVGLNSFLFKWGWVELKSGNPHSTLIYTVHMY